MKKFELLKIYPCPKCGKFLFYISDEVIVCFNCKREFKEKKVKERINIKSNNLETPFLRREIEE